MKAPITKEYILRFFTYDKIKGSLIWRDHWCKEKKRFIGKEASSMDRGYKHLRLEGKNLGVHRLIYFLETNTWPLMVDHIDGNKLNNHISNLRAATSRKNQQNQYRHRDGKLVGGTFLKNVNKWKAQILLNKKRICLGHFNTELEAHKVYMRELKKHYANGGI